MPLSFQIINLLYYNAFAKCAQLNLSLFSPKQQIRTGSQQDDLHGQQRREEYLEIPVLHFVMEHLHPEQTAQSSKAGRNPKQRLFRYAPLPLTGASLVVPHHQKGDYVYYRNDGQRHEYNR